MGAGRIPASHALVQSLLKKFDLHQTPIVSEDQYKASGQSEIVPNVFETAIVPLAIEPLKKLSPTVLSQNTIRSLWNRIYGTRESAELNRHFAYWSEINVLRADLAVSSFLTGSMSPKET